MRDEYRTTRFLYLLEAAFEYFISLLLTGAYIAKVAGAIGLSDSTVGIVTSIVALGTSFQFFAVFLSHKFPVKRWVTVFHTINQILLSCVWLTPLFPVGKELKAVLFIAFLLVGYAINHIINSPKINWLMATVDDKNRGRFTAKKEMVSLIGGSIFTYLMGNVFDYFEAQGNQKTAFLIGAVTMLILAMLHTLTLVFSKEKPVEKKPIESPAKEISSLLRNRRLRAVVLIGALYNISSGISYSFYGTYQVNELGFSMSFIAIMSAAHTVVRCICSVVLGRYADRHSFSSMLRWSFGMLFVGELVMAFTVPANGYIFYSIFFVLFYAVFGAGYANGVMNLTYDTVTKEQRVSAFALYNCACGIMGFLASIPGSLIVKTVQKNGNQLFGHTVYAQQILAVIAAALVGILWFILLRAFPKESYDKASN